MTGYGDSDQTVPDARRYARGCIENGGCPVWERCFDEAARRGERHFVWGGTTPNQRAAMNRTLAAARASGLTGGEREILRCEWESHRDVLKASVGRRIAAEVARVARIRAAEAELAERIEASEEVLKLAWASGT